MKRFVFIAVAVLGFGMSVAIGHAQSLPHWGTTGWVQFPSNDFSEHADPGIDLTSSAQLALTAAGPNNAMTYTVATYELVPLSGTKPMKLQIFDAPITPEPGRDQGDPSAEMELIFVGPGVWTVQCWSNADGKLISVADQNHSRVPISGGACDFFGNAWSESLIIKSSRPLLMKTIWKGATEEKGYANIPANYQDLLNVFRLQSHNGVVRLARTAPNRIADPSGNLLPWRTMPVKADFEQALNWVVLYKTLQETFFRFEVDVSDIQEDYLIIWDKDADANQLFQSKGYPAASPPDDGLNMLVRWSDGSPLQYDIESNTLEGGIPITEDPEWTHFDQTDRNEFEPEWNIPGETNSFDGPSWDSGQDPYGDDALRWYRIPIHERKSDSVVVGWYGSSMPNNTFALAASGPLALSDCQEASQCTQIFEEATSDPSDVENDDDEVAEVDDSPCVVSGYAEVCVSSTPLPHPAEASYGLDASKADKNWIAYHFELRNLNDEDIGLEDVELFFEPPVYTSLHPDELRRAQASTGGSYSGKGPGVIEIADVLTASDSLMIDLKVQLDEGLGMSDYDLSSEERFRFRFANNPELVARGLVHHAGKGGEFVTASRCYAYDYFGGEFTCSDQCQRVEPGTRITVRDRLSNSGGASVYDYLYAPLPLSEAFDYEAYSIRIDDPVSGLLAPNDGTSFPPVSGVLIPGAIGPDQSRDLFFSYYVPEDVLQGGGQNEGRTMDNEEDGSQNEERTMNNGGEEGSCFSAEVPTQSEEDAGTPLEYDPDCESSAPGGSSGPGRGVICVGIEDNPLLEGSLSALPSPGTRVYQGSVVQYVLNLQNLTRQSVASLEIFPIQPEQSSCQSGNCSGISLIDPPELSQKFGELLITFLVKVNDDATGNRLVHPGFEMIYTGVGGEELELSVPGIEHQLLSVPEPTGDFQHDIQLSRRTVLNAADRNHPRQDQADQTIVSHQFLYSGTQKSPVWPEIQGQRNYQHNVCSFRYPSYEYYDASFNSQSYFYNGPLGSPQMRSFDQIRSGDVDFAVTTISPSERPELLIVDGSAPYVDRFEETFEGMGAGSRGINRFMQNGGTVWSHELPETTLRAVADGTGGLVNTENTVLSLSGTGSISEDLWMYQQTGTRRDRNRCIQCGRRRCYRYDAYVPEYFWQKVTSRNIPLQASDQDYVSVLTSVAWLQTKNGHMGFGSSLWGNGPTTGDPNWVDLGDRSVPSFMKFYTPPNQSNADLFISSPAQADPLESGLGDLGRVQTTPGSEGFLEGEHLARGEAYDREVYPREYLDDLLHKGLYGKVVRLNGNTPLPAGFERVGSQFRMVGQIVLEPYTIYHLQGGLSVGRGTGDEVQIAGGRARVVVDGDVEILSNVAYASGRSDDLEAIPSLRLHSLGDIQISPGVTELELMMLAEEQFFSGKSDQQLRILGDVIAKRAAWERSPLNADRGADEAVNKPSELILEDFRKYLVPPPGDQMMTDQGWSWMETKNGG